MKNIIDHADFQALDNRINEMPVMGMLMNWKSAATHLFNSNEKHIVAIKATGGFGKTIMTPFIKKRLQRGEKVLIVTHGTTIYPRAKDLSIIFGREENPIIKHDITIIGYQRFILDKFKDVINQDFDLTVFDNFNSGRASKMYKKVNAFDSAKQILKIRGAHVDETPTGIYTSENPILK